MVLYATDHERQLIVAALSFYAQHLGNVASPAEQAQAAALADKSKPLTDDSHSPGGVDEADRYAFSSRA
ncbi:MAG: hypothetical protein ACLU8S_04760 [Coprococcus phoceensis]